MANVSLFLTGFVRRYGSVAIVTVHVIIPWRLGGARVTYRIRTDSIGGRTDGGPIRFGVLFALLYSMY